MDGHCVKRVETFNGTIATANVLLTGGASLQEVGELAGVHIPAGAVRHQVAITEPHRNFQVERQAMGFAVADGLYWRLEDGGLLFGMSNSDEPPGPAKEIDWAYMEAVRKRLARLIPITEGRSPAKARGATH